MATDAFPEINFSKNCYIHDIGKLVELANLKAKWEAATTADSELSGNWGIAKDWSEQKRYHRISETEARLLYSAVANDTHGVFQWIKTQWTA